MGRQDALHPYRYLRGLWDSLVAVGMLHPLGGGPEPCAAGEEPPANRVRLTALEQQLVHRMRQEPGGRGGRGA
ncbi:hypothetical protein [Streptomyces sp. Tu 3180]|uniref:hypothetical protein n=1 Tax=Streptomyces sp. Tu 3180 TaxID=2682611 RepID=UPI001359C350|nr:hypothetical protein [Streptomyces sp. Tu 3180]KAF3469363.1 hypothetical protein GL259_37400 [Streptomyces sp. Tu 3180]